MMVLRRKQFPADLEGYPAPVRNFVIAAAVNLCLLYHLHPSLQVFPGFFSPSSPVALFAYSRICLNATAVKLA